MPGRINCVLLLFIKLGCAFDFNPFDIPEKPDGPASDPCDAEYVLRNKSDRLCVGGTCKYGYCYKELGPEFCKCDASAWGLYCDQACCKDCSENGICKQNSTTQTESCSCSGGYTGEFCEIKGTCPCLNGQCRSSSLSECDCDDGWSGDECDLETPTISTTLETIVRTYNVCEEAYKKRPLNERKCSNVIMDCHFGRCVTKGLVYCKCDIGVSPGDQLCKEKCCKYCGEHGDCYYNTKLEQEMCNCHDNYTGDLCESKKVFPSTEPHKYPRWVYWVPGVCGFLLVALVILLVIMPYFLWRRRVILVMKLVHYFKGYEDDDDSKWDAFISYKSNTPDEDFVVHTLFPKLTLELGFSVNVHFKDFTPGEEITNNIIHAVENSRRTILIVSPNYLASNFAKFEWQTAQQRMLERRHRIIPILLEDVSSYHESMDPNLRQILASVTYIEWPHDETATQKKTDKFWKRIELSMPKKKQKRTEIQTII
ncbi:protein eyes shut homolog [Mya arenaria]|uniref:protein eyes shut homolog n=1 Tax=Mya arenaria TaxID=6604 RepID=UPI0022E8A9DB|nr:protein eyes shut homolog [Mya arenaria]